MRTPVVLGCVLVGVTSAQAAPQVSRADLARSYLQFEQALQSRASTLEADERARIERAFDQATIAFFSRAYGRAIQTINGLSIKLLGDDAPSGLAYALKATVTPARGVVGMSARPTLALHPLYAAGEGTVTVRLVRNAKAVASRTVRVAGTGAAPKAWDALQTLKPGAYAIEVGSGGKFALAGRWTVVSKAPAGVRRALTARLDALKPESEGLIEAVACCRARIGLLGDAPRGDDLATVLVDPEALALSLAAEVEALEQGRDPYARRTGELWRSLRVGAAKIPFRLFAPSEAKTERLPLVIAFHGLGGDENMFRYGYGGGELIRQAERRKLLVVTPRTEGFLRAPQAFDRLLGVLRRQYRIDTTRIYLAGHSMGTGAVGLLARSRTKQIAGAVCFAGRGTGGKVPTLIVRGEQDPFARMAFGRRPGAPKGTVKSLAGYGHTLLVGEQLGPALDWLSKHRRQIWY